MSESADDSRITVDSTNVIQDGWPIGRLATAWLILDRESTERDVADVVRRVAAELNNDGRVRDVELPIMDERWHSFSYIYPWNPNIDADNADTDWRAAALMSHPIRFKVRSPRNVQETFALDDTAPSEEYSAIWNGQFLLVTWVDDGKPLLTWGAGGHVVLEALSEAIGRAGAELQVQACSPGCNHQFLHVNARVQRHLDGPFGLHTTKIGGTFCFHFPVHVAEPPDLHFFNYVRRSFDHHSVAQNYTQRITVLRHALWSEVRGLVRLQNEIETSTMRSALRHPLGRLRSLRWRRNAKRSMSRIWVMLTAAELLRARRQQRIFQFSREAGRMAIADLFAGDIEDDESDMENLDFSMIVKTIEHAESRLQNSAVVAATAFTVVGALGGAALTAALASGQT